MERVIGDGPNALNDYISSGEIEELRDVIPATEEVASDNEGDEAEAKRSKKDKIINHNAQVIYGSIEGGTSQSIPSLLALNVKLDGSGPPPSLLNLNVPPPFDEMSGGSGNWQRQEFARGANKESQKRRNRDSDGNRISRFDRDGSRSSRFDGNENRNRRNASNRNRRN